MLLPPSHCQEMSPIWHAVKGETSFSFLMNSLQTEETQPPQQGYLLTISGNPASVAYQAQMESCYTEKVPALVPDWSSFMRWRNYICSLIGPNNIILIGQNRTSWLVLWSLRDRLLHCQIKSSSGSTPSFPIDYGRQKQALFRQVYMIFPFNLVWRLHY